MSFDPYLKKNVPLLRQGQLHDSFAGFSVQSFWVNPWIPGTLFAGNVIRIKLQYKKMNESLCRI